MDFLKAVLDDKGTALAGDLVDKFGFSSDQAQAFVPEAARSVFDAIQEKSGELDLSDLASNSGALIDNVDIDALAMKVGIDSSQVTSGLSDIVPTLVSSLQERAGGLSGLLTLFRGKEVEKTLSAVGGMAGKLFGK